MTDSKVRRDIHYALARADRHWAQQHMTHPMPPDRLDALSRGLEAVVVLAIQDQRVADANERGCLARLIEAVVGEWVPGVDAGEQTAAALKQVHQVRAYLRSQQDEQEVA